jgi:hypothetical protein
MEDRGDQKMKNVKAYIEAASLHQAGLSFLWIALLLLTPCLVAADAALPQGPVIDGVYLSEVTLDSFTATWAGSQVMVDWKTEVERYNAGFNLYRAVHDTHPFIRLNRALIPSQALGPGGAVYEFGDACGAAGTEYDYWLESVDIQGLPRYLGTISAQPAAGDPAASPGQPCRVLLPQVSR